MSEGPKEPLDYSKPDETSPGKQVAGVGCLVAAVALAAGVAFFGAMVVGMAWDNDNFGQAALCIVVPLALTGLGIALRRKMSGLLSVAAAISLIAVATFLLLFGICANNIRF